MSVASAALLVLALAAYVYFFKGDFGRLSVLETLRPPGWRRRRYRIWIAKSWLFFAGPALVGLAGLGRIGAVAAMPPAFAAPAFWFGYPTPAADLIGEVLTGLAAGVVVGGGLSLWSRRRRRRPVMLGDFSMLLPETPAEALLAAGAAVSAGIAEELYFRLLIPLLIANLMGSAWAGFAVASVLFGLAHLYQRWVGVLATTLIGLLFAALYLQSGALWLAMAAHATIDLNALVLRPVIAGMLRRTGPADGM